MSFLCAACHARSAERRVFVTAHHGLLSRVSAHATLLPLTALNHVTKRDYWTQQRHSSRSSIMQTNGMELLVVF